MLARFFEVAAVLVSAALGFFALILPIYKYAYEHDPRMANLVDPDTLPLATSFTLTGLVILLTLAARRVRAKRPHISPMSAGCAVVFILLAARCSYLGYVHARLWLGYDVYSGI